MDAKASISQLKDHAERLRREALDVASNARQIVFQGLERLVEQEIKALNNYYKSALKSARKGAPARELAKDQVTLLQETMESLVRNARESLSIISDTRAELARLTTQDSALSAKDIERVTRPAKKALREAGKSAQKARSTAEKTARKMSKDLTGEVKSARKSASKNAKKASKAVSKTATKARKAAKKVVKKASE